MEHDHAAHAAHAAEAAGAPGAGGGGLAEFFDQQWFMPHGHCYLWKPELLGLHVCSDILIGLAYLGISLILWYLVRRVRLPFSPMIIAFGTFIGACGLTHFMSVWNVWNADYWIAGLVKFVTAVASVATAAFLLPMRARIVAVASAAEIAEAQRRELEEKNRELQALYAQVKAMNEARTAFFANVSHELRTPLSLVLGPVERLLADERTDPGCREALVTVQRNANLLLKQVNTLLDAARMEAGETRLEPKPVELATLARVTCASFESVAAGRELTFEVETPSHAWVQGEPDKLQGVLLNLLSNAFKFAPVQGGRVRLVVSEDEAQVRVTVSDNGPGVPVAWRDRVFERFQQVERGDTRQKGGTGLGLAIARDVVLLHGGDIRVVEASGLGGAQFEVTLPRIAPPDSEAELGVHDPSEHVTRAKRWAEEVRTDRLAPEGAPDLGAAVAGERLPRVLVVEDNPDLRRFLRDTLGDALEVHTAADGREGLARALALRPHVIVSDLMMPHLSGAELLAAVRQEASLAGTSVLMLTARDEEPMRVELLAAGAQDFLAKPFSAAELRARVTGLARAARARGILQRALATRGEQIDALASAVEARTRDLEVALEVAKAARAEAERASEAKSTFLSLVSHELRTPLTTIRLNAEATERAMAKEGLTPPAGLRRIRDGSRRLYELVDSVLEFTRVESGRLARVSGEVDVAALATEVVDELLPEAQRKLIRLELELSGEGPRLRTDPRLVRLILSNLVTNAVKFTDHGRVTVRALGAASGWTLEVQDTGPGIPADARVTIFEPFFQLAELRHKSTPGMGLGLALVRRMADAVGARVTLESEAGKGSLFRVVLPVEVDGEAN